MLAPGTQVEYLGYVFCSVPVTHVRVPQHKVQRARQLFTGVLRKAAAVGPQGVQAGSVRIHGHTLASALGFLQSLRLAVSVVPVFTHELYVCLNDLPKSFDGCFEFSSMVSLSADALEECRFWQDCVARWNGFVLPPLAVSRVLYTDGCGGGFGALVHRVNARKMEPAEHFAAGSWEHTASTDSVFTELEGLWRAVVAAGQELVGQTVLHRTDSISTYAVVRRGGSARSQRLTAIVRRLMVYCMKYDITLASQYVGAGVIIRSGADLLSRSADVSDGCKLNPAVFGRLWRVYGPFAADMFASSATVQAGPGGKPLPYWSLFADGHSVGVDAMTADWRGGVARYAFPPVRLVGEVMQLVLEQGAKALLVVPQWPAQWWWPILLERASLPPVQLSQLQGSAAEGPLLVQGRRGLPPHPFGHGWVSDPESVQWVAVLLGY
jgi:hypothetical protein